MLAEPKCFTRNCVHFEGVKSDSEEDESGQRCVCAAFPDGIPDEIAYGDNLHLTPFPGDNGITFKAGDATANPA